jgi:predicted nucleic acid-binding protein
VENHAQEPRPVLVDRSLRVDLVASARVPAAQELGRLVEEEVSGAVTGVIASEVVQGAIRGATSVEHDWAKFVMLQPQGFATHRNAAAILRTSRPVGNKLAQTGAAIAAVALEYEAAVFTVDHDFSRIARSGTFRYTS